MTIDLSTIPRDRRPALLSAMPKAELHIHIDRSLEPELIFKLAQRQAYPNEPAGRGAQRSQTIRSQRRLRPLSRA